VIVGEVDVVDGGDELLLHEVGDGCVELVDCFPLVAGSEIHQASSVVCNLFNLGRHLVRAQHYQDLRVSAFGRWMEVVA
jgi:hypothetical protein